MMVPDANHCYLGFLQDIHDVSTACGTTTYIWGGFTLDVVEGCFLREHHDLDGFTLNLLSTLDRMTAMYQERGYATEFRKDIDMLVISRDGLHAALNRLEVDGEIAMWRHIGDEGTVYFPRDWLDDAPRDFYGTPVYTAGMRLDYALKTNVRLVHAEWSARPKDLAAIARLESLMERQGIDPDEFLTQVWAYNPFWAKRGYPEYAMPVVARPLYPLNEERSG